MKLPIPILVLSGLFVSAPVLLAQDAVPVAQIPGHSAHGEGFSEGPRRRGPLIEGCGDVHFPVTTTNPEAQRWFDAGVAQLHGFWYWEAERSFRTVLVLDPECTMAYWGLAMSNIDNFERARKFLEKAAGPALEKLPGREKAWIESARKFYADGKDDAARKAAATQHVKDLEDIAEKYPEDIEARAFAAGFIWWNSSRRGIPMTSPLATDALVQTVLAKNPNHPAHHYLIHLWDHENASMALPAAGLCGPSAPAIAHMWHMPGHIYSDLERWADAAWQQEAAARVDHAAMIRSHTMPDQIHNFAHNSEWLVRNLNNLGRVKDALTISTNLIEMPRIPRSNAVKENPDQQYNEGGSAWQYGRNRLTETILRWELWDTALALADTPWLEPGTDFEDQWQREQLIGIAAWRTGDTARGQAMREALEKRVADLRSERAAEADKAEEAAAAEGKNGDALDKIVAEAMKPFSQKIRKLREPLAELRLLADLAAGRKDEAKAALDSVKGLHKQRLAWIHQALGDFEKAADLCRANAAGASKQVQPQALFVDALWQAGKKDEALKEFETLRRMSGLADPGLPVLTRLAPVAEATGCQGDWRLAAEPAKDLGPRPDMNSLGPLRWHGWPAASWTASGPDGQAFTPQSMAGKPFVLIFFLGNACSHCNEQIAAFAKENPQFEAAGIPVIAVSTDTAEEVTATQNKPPFPVFSGADTVPFKAMDAWDDFENQPLHGTWFVDGAGTVRWQHISYEPFMRPDFLLGEAQRLLRLDNRRPPEMAGVGTP